MESIENDLDSKTSKEKLPELKDLMNLAKCYDRELPLPTERMDWFIKQIYFKMKTLAPEERKIQICRPRFIVRGNNKWIVYTPSKVGERMNTLEKNKIEYTSLDFLPQELRKSHHFQYIMDNIQEVKDGNVRSPFIVYYAIFHDRFMDKKLPSPLRSFAWSAYVGKAQDGFFERWGTDNNHLSAAHNILKHCYDNIEAEEFIPMESKKIQAIDAALAYWGMDSDFNNNLVVFLLKQLPSLSEMNTTEAHIIRTRKMFLPIYGINDALQ